MKALCFRFIFSSISCLLVAGCVTPLDDGRQTKLDGVILYGIVNVAPSAQVTLERFSSPLAKRSCSLYPDHWCTAMNEYDFASVLLMNTYGGGTRSVGTAIPKSEKVSKSDIVVVRFRKFGGAEFMRVASRGERSDCQWVGGSLFRTMTAAGVKCESYDWEKIAPMFYN